MRACASASGLSQLALGTRNTVDHALIVRIVYFGINRAMNRAANRANPARRGVGAIGQNRRSEACSAVAWNAKASNLERVSAESGTRRAQ